MFLNAGSTGILTEMIHHGAGLPMCFRCLLSLALPTESEKYPPVIVTAKSIPCSILGIRRKETWVSLLLSWGGIFVMSLAAMALSRPQ